MKLQWKQNDSDYSLFLGGLEICCFSTNDYGELILDEDGEFIYSWLSTALNGEFDGDGGYLLEENTVHAAQKYLEGFIGQEWVGYLEKIKS